jgi:hypothetical protein
MATNDANENRRISAFPVERNSAMGPRPRSATAADVPEQAVEPNVFLVDPLSQGIFTGLDLIGTFDIMPGRLPDCRSVRGCHRCRQDDESGKNQAQGSAAPH